ncbi:hypothetical protein J1N35_022679, partial [Gossypium stocksii]
DSSHKVVAGVSAKNVLVVSIPKFKQRKVSVVRDFLPGCGRMTASNLGLTRQITVDRPSEGDNARDYLILYMIRCVSVYTVLIVHRLKS